MDLAIDVQVSSSESLEVEGESLSSPGKAAIVLGIVVDYGGLALVVLLGMLHSSLMLFGFLSEPTVFLTLYVMKFMESCF
jgi:hypothetical protein